MFKNKFALCVFTALAALCAAFGNVHAAETAMKTPVIEESTESPIADMALLDVDMKTSTEKPPTAEVGEPPMDSVPKENADKNFTQRHTVADFIIHPLIAFKPRETEDPNALSKQASSTPSSSTPSPWQLFGFNAGQGLGSSVSSLAGSVTGWLNDRIQLPGLVDTPVRESTTSTSTTTTTVRPDIVVRVQHKPTTRRPLIQINGNNRPNRFHNNNNNNNNDHFDSEEQDDDYYEENDFQGDRFDEEFDDENDDEGDNAIAGDYEDDQSNEYEEAENDDDREEFVQRPNSQRRPVQQQQQQQRRRKIQQQGQQQNQRLRPNFSTQRQQSVSANNRRRPIQQHLESEESYGAEDDDDVEVSDDNANDLFFGQTQYASSSKRSQNQPNFIQRGQQNLINQIRQFTRGQTPAEIGNKIRTSSQAAVPINSINSNNNKQHPQRATLLVNRNGHPVYVAPELLDFNAVPSAMVSPTYQYFPNQQTMIKTTVPVSSFPQPPLTVPLKRKGRPTQYITIPWSQLGISPPDQQIVSIADGIQSQPLILNIPQSAVNTMQMSSNQKKRPIITSDAVPLLADASLMGIFQPPQIPPSRTSTSQNKPAVSLAVSGNHSPVLIATKPKPMTTSKGTASLLPTRIRPGTIVEKAPLDTGMEKPASDGQKQNIAPATVLSQAYSQPAAERRHTDNKYIIVGEDNESDVTHQSEPVYSEARYVAVNDYSPYVDLLQRRFAVRKSGRALEEPTTNNDQIVPIAEPSKESTPVEIAQVVNQAAEEAKQSEQLQQTMTKL